MTEETTAAEDLDATAEINMEALSLEAAPVDDAPPVDDEPARKLPADLFRPLNRTERRRVPHHVTLEMLQGCVVCFRASSRLAEIGDDKKQVTIDGKVKMHLFSPGDEVPSWVIEHYSAGSLIAQGRIYCSPLPVMKTFSAVQPAAPVEVVEVEDETPGAKAVDLRPLRELDSKSMRAIRTAFLASGVDFPNGASKSELLARRDELLAGE